MESHATLELLVDINDKALQASSLLLVLMKAERNKGEKPDPALMATIESAREIMLLVANRADTPFLKSDPTPETMEVPQ